MIANYFQTRGLTVAVGPYYATPSWDQTFPAATRFIVLSNMNNEAVLDRETGLVWQRTPILTLNHDNRGIPSINCSLAVTGGRQGWRLRVDEIVTLADTSNNQSFQLHLPPGHPPNLAVESRPTSDDLQGAREYQRSCLCPHIDGCPHVIA